MPTVIGINQVPPNVPRPTFFDYTGQLSGAVSRQLADAVLAYLTGGAYQNNQRNIKNPSYGQPTPNPTLNPSVQLQPAQPQANPLAPPPIPQSIIPQISTPPQQAIFPNRPTLSVRDIEAAQAIAKTRQLQNELDPNSPENRVRTSTANLYEQYAKQLNQPSSPTPTSKLTPEQLKGLADLALQGDEESITLLRSLGEL